MYYVYVPTYVPLFEMLFIDKNEIDMFANLIG